MQGQQDSQRVLFDTIDLESVIPDDHMLRRIDARVDFDFIYEVTKDLHCADNGRCLAKPLSRRLREINLVHHLSKSINGSLSACRNSINRPAAFQYVAAGRLRQNLTLSVRSGLSCHG